MQLVATKQKNLIVGIVLTLLLLLLTACGRNEFKGKWKANLDDGTPLKIVIDSKKIRFDQGGETADYPYTITTGNNGKPMLEAKSNSVSIMAQITDYKEAEHKDLNGALYMLVSFDGGYTSNEILGIKQGGVSFLQVVMYALIGICIIAYMKSKKGKDKTHG